MSGDPEKRAKLIADARAALFPKCRLCGNDPFCCPCIVAELERKADLELNYDRWVREGRPNHKELRRA